MAPNLEVIESSATPPPVYVLHRGVRSMDLLAHWRPRNMVVVIDDWREYCLPHRPRADPQWPAPRSVAEAEAHLARLSPFARAGAVVTALEEAVRLWHRWLDVREDLVRPLIYNPASPPRGMMLHEWYRDGVVDHAVEALVLAWCGGQPTEAMRDDATAYAATLVDERPRSVIEQYCRMLDDLDHELEQEVELCSPLLPIVHALEFAYWGEIYDVNEMLRNPRDPDPTYFRLGTLGEVANASHVFTGVNDAAQEQRDIAFLERWWRKAQCRLAFAGVTTAMLDG